MWWYTTWCSSLNEKKDKKAQMINYYLLFLFLSLSLDENFGKLKLSVKNLTILCISLLLFWILIFFGRWAWFLCVGRKTFRDFNWLVFLFSKKDEQGTFLIRRFERKWYFYFWKFLNCWHLSTFRILDDWKSACLKTKY